MRRVLAVLVFTLAFSVGAPVALAGFTQQSSATSAFSAATLSPPTSLTAIRQCGVLLYEIVLSWTATTSGWADGYEVSIATASSGPYTVVPVGAADPLVTTRTVGLLLANTTYWFRVTATKNSWRSTHAQASETTSPICL